MSGFETPIDPPNTGVECDTSGSFRPPQRYSWPIRQILEKAMKQDGGGFKEPTKPTEAEIRAGLDEQEFHYRNTFLMD